MFVCCVCRSQVKLLLFLLLLLFFDLFSLSLSLFCYFFVAFWHNLILLRAQKMFHFDAKNRKKLSNKTRKHFARKKQLLALFFWALFARTKTNQFVSFSLKTQTNRTNWQTAKLRKKEEEKEKHKKKTKKNNSLNCLVAKK